MSPAARCVRMRSAVGRALSADSTTSRYAGTSRGGAAAQPARSTEIVTALKIISALAPASEKYSGMDSHSNINLASISDRERSVLYGVASDPADGELVILEPHAAHSGARFTTD